MSEVLYGTEKSVAEALRVGNWALQDSLNAVHELDFELEVRDVGLRARLLASDLISNLLHPDPDHRPTSFVAVLSHVIKSIVRFL